TSAPLSVPLTVSVPTLVILSVLSPVSLASTTVGAATTVSYVNVKLVDPDTLPATSVCLTYTVFAPWLSAGALVLQPLVPLAEYSTSAPLSVPLTVSVPTLVILSVLSPVSLASTTVGAATTVSYVNVKLVDPDTL